MTKVVLSDLSNLNNPASAVSTLNNNNTVIEQAFDNTLSRDGTSPNEMESQLDMNSNHIINLPDPIYPNSPIRYADAVSILGVTPSTFLSSQTGAVARTWNSKVGETISVMDFGAVGDGVANDTVAIQTAYNSLLDGQVLYFPNKTFRINSNVTHTTSNTGVHFDNTKFLIYDKATRVPISDGNIGHIGFSFKNITNFSCTGNVIFKGLGFTGPETVPNVTDLCGVVLDTCNYVRWMATSHFETMALGILLLTVKKSVIGHMTGYNIDGVQTFDSVYPSLSSAGSLQVLASCEDVALGDAICTNIDKPVRYYSVSSLLTNNKRITCGSTFVEGIPNSDLAHAIGLRSGIDCSFGPITVGINSIFGALVVQYLNDQSYGFKIDRCYFSSIIGTSNSTPSSVEALISVESQDVADLGTIHVGHIEGTCDGLSGIYLTSGKLIINSAKLGGSCNRLVRVASATNISKPYVSINHLTINGHSGLVAPINIGRGGQLRIGRLNLDGGPGTASIEAVRYDPTIGHVSFAGHLGVEIDYVYYNQNGTPNNYGDLLYDSAHGLDKWTVGHVEGIGSTAGQALLGSDRFFFKRGLTYSYAIPTTMLNTRNLVVWNSLPSSGGTPGWVCTTTGTPGTWKAMANLA